MSALGSTGFFVRMSNRSPKDGMPLDRAALRRDFLQELGVQDEGAACSSDDLMTNHSPNDIMVAFSGAVSSALRVSNGREAMCLLLSSERVFSDLHLALDCAEHPDDRWGTYLIVREWDDQLRHDWEFRCFVKEGELYAISQYNHYCVFPEIVEACQDDGGQALKQEIVEYWSTAKAAIECDGTVDYVFDAARLADGRWCIVELNPYATGTGGCLYHWNELNELQSHKGGCDIRIKQGLLEEQEELSDFVEACVMPQIDLSDANPNADPGSSSEFTGPWERFLRLADQEAEVSEEVKTAAKRCCIS